MATCFACGGTGVTGEGALSGTCYACNGEGAIGIGGAPRALATETFRVTGKATERAIITWQDGTETHCYRPTASGPEGP